MKVKIFPQRNIAICAGLFLFMFACIVFGYKKFVKDRGNNLPQKQEKIQSGSGTAKNPSLPRL